MRINLWIFCLLVCAALGAKGQKDSVHLLQARNLSFVLGGKAGMTYSAMQLANNNPDFDVQSTSRRGIYLGLMYHIPLNPRWAFQPEVVYSSQGYRMKVQGPGYSYEEEDPHYFLGVPLLLQHVSPAGITLHTGPQAGLLVSGNPDLKEVDLLWVVGGGYISRKGLGVEVRYNAGLVDLATNKYAFATVTEARNRVVQVAIVYYFARAQKRARAGGWQD